MADGYYDFVQKSRAEATAKSAEKLDEQNLAQPRGGRETLAEHKQHCKAEPGNCPFEKAFYEADDLGDPAPKTTKPILYDRLSMALTQLYALGAEVAKSAIDDDSNAAKTVSEALEGGIERIREICEKAGCVVDMDEAKTKYIIVPPKHQETSVS